MYSPIIIKYGLVFLIKLGKGNHLLSMHERCLFSILSIQLQGGNRLRTNNYTVCGYKGILSYLFFITNQHEIQDYAPISNLILTATVTLSIPDGFC